MNILKPEIKIIVIHVETINKVCPRSGWLIRNAEIRSKIKKEYKYLP